MMTISAGAEWLASVRGYTAAVYERFWEGHGFSHSARSQ